MRQSFFHLTVLKAETIQSVLPSEHLLNFLKTSQENILFYVDATLGGGGHSEFLVEQFEKTGLFKDFYLYLIGIDKDKEALEYSEAKFLGFKEKYKKFNYFLINDDFRNLKDIFTKEFPGKKLHGLFADFGVSSRQLDRGERGFSFLHDGPLDMRMDFDSKLTARLVLQHYSQQELTRILFEYGEEPKARLLARSIVKDRKIKKLPLESTVKLAFYIKNILAYPHSRIHPATRTFQALRIEVNQELESIKNLFKDIPLLVNQFARVAFISFHSLEDRLVKQTLRSWQKGKIFKEQNLCKKEDHIPLHFKLHVEENQSKGFGKETPRGGVATSPLECQNNPRARSARLRCFEFLENP